MWLIVKNTYVFLSKFLEKVRKEMAQVAAIALYLTDKLVVKFSGSGFCDFKKFIHLNSDAT